MSEKPVELTSEPIKARGNPALESLRPFFATSFRAVGIVFIDHPGIDGCFF